MSSHQLDESEIVIYLLVRTDLKMGKGKIAAQCGHAVQELILMAPKPLLNMYLASKLFPKICLSIKDDEEMNKIEEKCQEINVLYHRVIDAGRTQLAPNTATVLGIGPISKNTAKEIVGYLKLL